MQNIGNYRYRQNPKKYWDIDFCQYRIPLSDTPCRCVPYTAQRNGSTQVAHSVHGRREPQTHAELERKYADLTSQNERTRS